MFLRRVVFLAAMVLASSPACAQMKPAAMAPVPRPRVLRGLYVNRWAVLDDRIREMIGIAKRTEVNALVIDVKDDRGYVLYKSAVPLAQQIGSDTINPVPAAQIRAVLDSMRANGVFPIARIVVAKDPLLAGARREWAVQRADDGTPWLDGEGKPWLDAHHREIWTYAADLAAEAIALGFSEVQFDYVRFPDDPRLLREAAFPLAKSRPRARVIAEQLEYLHKRIASLRVPMSIDVFGLTTTDPGDMNIGQQWEQFAPHANIVQPMTYPSHYSTGMYGLENPNANPYAVIDHALKDAKARNAHVKHAPEIVPWYQDFSIGEPPYGPEQVRAQMQAGYDNDIRSWLLWNAGSTYTIEALKPEILSPAEEKTVRSKRP
ncbi:MAG: putative glycosyl hydrolase domain [Gemmatimonadetes bacterium]|nr:putative glycosyl hydrolase domain [Gemmatimonadota bacterium]